MGIEKMQRELFDKFVQFWEFRRVRKLQSAKRKRIVAVVQREI